MNSLFRYYIRKPIHPNKLVLPRTYHFFSQPRNSRFFSMKRNINNSIVLDETETSIRDLLVKFCDYHNSQPDCDANKQLELRITGGWVRDKLLGNESHDIDIAINFLSGEEFANALNEFVLEYHPELKLKAFHKIKKNPEKSKHLETCTTKLFGLDIDFVNLRNEQYSNDSRVPVIECGTAEEDALRRDATLNALFYNLNQNVIEDFTGKGLDDLREGILRTPLQPLQTFLDDPLRVLRLIRFASKFNFIIETGTLNSMKDPQIKSTLINKISRERVGVELEKILSSNNPEYGIKLINHVGLSHSIFNTSVLYDTIVELNDSETVTHLQESNDQLDKRIDDTTNIIPLLTKNLHELNTQYITKIYDDLTTNELMVKLIWLTMITQPFGLNNVRINHKKPLTTSAVEVILKEGLRLGKHDFEPALNITRESCSSYETLNKFFQDPSSLKRSDLGLYLRSFGQYSNLNIIFNCLNDILKQINLPSTIEEVPYPKALGLEPSSDVSQIISQTIQRYDSLIGYINDLGLVEVYKLKPIVDGKLLSKQLNKKPGPWMSQILSDVLTWQLDNPNGSQKDCLEYIKESLSNSI